jgi:hypothetical protein
MIHEASSGTALVRYPRIELFVRPHIEECLEVRISPIHDERLDLVQRDHAFSHVIPAFGRMLISEPLVEFAAIVLALLEFVDGREPEVDQIVVKASVGVSLEPARQPDVAESLGRVLSFEEPRLVVGTFFAMEPSCALWVGEPVSGAQFAGTEDCGAVRYRGTRTA